MSSLDALKDLFASASSQEHNIAREACVHLNRLSGEHGFYSAVTRIATDPVADLGARLQAVLFLKNAVDTIWRKNRASTEGAPLSEEERQPIRSLLLNSYNDESSQISLHMAIVISKIARFDCPQNWPELVPQLASTIDCSVAASDTIAHERALFILYYVVKTLASKRLAVDKRIFHELCLRVFVPVYGYWKAHLSQAGVSVISSSSAALCLKSLRYMVIYGFSDPSSNDSVNEFLSSLGASVQTILQLLVAPAENEVFKGNLEKIILVALKLIGEFQEHSALDFVYWMASCLELADFCAFGVCSAALPSLVHVRAFNIMKLTLLCQDYRISAKSDTAVGPQDPVVQAGCISVAFFSADRVRGFCQLLIERYLVLTAEELQTWRADPESYATTDDSEAWRHMIRPAAESFFIALVHECWEYLAPLANQWLQIAVAPIDFQNINEVLARDAVFTAIGLTANDLYEELDFDSLFTNVCVAAMTTTTVSETQRIILRRIVWLCGKWIDVKFSKELRPKLYESIIRIVGRANEDIVIRLAACNAFKRALDEYEFELETFRPHLNDAVTALIDLLRTCVESASQLSVVTTLWLLAERAGRELIGCLDAIIAYVPHLWQSENCMLKGQILNLFTQLVKGLGRDCIALLDGLSTMLATALNTEDPAHVYLLEDGLDLWLALVENCATPLPPQLLSLFRFMPGLLTVQSENLRICCDIVKSYYVYNDSEFANTYLAKLGQLFSSIIPEMRSEGVVCVVKVVEMSIRCFGKDALSPISDVILWCIETLLASKDTISVRIMCAAVVSLVSIQNVQQLYGVMAIAMSEQQITEFLKKWVELAGLISHDLERRKANGLGLCAWLSLPTQSTDSLFPDLVSVLVDILYDVCLEENGSYVDTLTTYDFGVFGGAEDNSGFPETEHDKRSQKLRDFDPVYNSSLQTHVVNALNAKKLHCELGAFDVLWRSVESDVAQSLKKLCALS